ncbi:MAG: AlkZ-related protein [Anaerolineae bacterium]|jgi:hypothetical protein|nr:hypothetical protein [Chloroflexota bacterium]
MSGAQPGAERTGTTITLQAVERWRDVRFRRVPWLRVRSEAEAVAFLDDVGLAFLFGEQGVAIPTLWWAVTGSSRPIPPHHDDPDLGRVWHWKDTLPERREIYYGKLLRGKPTLVSLKLLPAVYALSPNYGDPMDYLDQYEAGLLSVEARSIYEVLMAEGPLATTHLRRKAGLAGSGAIARRFDAALAELQTQLKIVKVGTSDVSRWGYAYVYDLFTRHFCWVEQAARAISTDAAMEQLLLTHLFNVGIEREAACARLFRWEPWEWKRVISRLIDRGMIETDLFVDAWPGPALGHTRALEQIRTEGESA